MAVDAMGEKKQKVVQEWALNMLVAFASVFLAVISCQRKRKSQKNSNTAEIFRVLSCFFCYQAIFAKKNTNTDVHCCHRIRKMV